ncbi:MAG: Spore germination protein B1 [Pelotomaculum sp. PtaU1.Bin065]|nr:MAG: Spore germination protein B1 [Pelotomaculum sp. PtaU1.Bin065]
MTENGWCGMSILANLLKLITYEENPDREGFVLKETSADQKATGKNEAPSIGKNSPDEQKKAQAGRGSFKKPVRPAGKVTEKPRKIKDSGEAGAVQTGQTAGRVNEKPVVDKLSVSASLAENRDTVGILYGLPENKDIIMRDIVIGTEPVINGFVIFIDGLVDKSVQDLLFQALMLFAAWTAPPEKGKLALFVKERLLPGNQITLQSRFRDILDAVNYGDTALFLEGCADALLVETKGWEHRGIDRPTIEQVVRGPQEAFGETLRTNTALIRKLIKNENLTTEFIKVGTRNQVNVAVMYLRDLANPALVAEVKRRIDSVKTDLIIDSGTLEELIEDNPYNLNPTVMATERPDRVAASIIEGRVGIIVDGSPFALIVPTTMYEMLHTGEELYTRWQFGTFIRYLRALAFYLSFLLPGLYLSVVLFHQEMIPTELLLAIAGNRERVPFPSLVEVLLMEISFELIREAGLRIPGVMGTTIGIVGALILGQAAVQANIVSPILVILVAVTGLSSFAIPYYSLAFSLRIYRFFYIAVGAMLGFFGISIGLFAQIILTANLKSFGVPYLAPIGPRTVTGADVVTRLPVFFHEKRPDYLNPLEIARQPDVSRGWLEQKDGGKDN